MFHEVDSDIDENELKLKKKKEKRKKVLVKPEPEDDPYYPSVANSDQSVPPRTQSPAVFHSAESTPTTNRPATSSTSLAVTVATQSQPEAQSVATALAMPSTAVSLTTTRQQTPPSHKESSLDPDDGFGSSAIVPYKPPADPSATMSELDNKLVRHALLAFASTPGKFNVPYTLREDITIITALADPAFSESHYKPLIMGLVGSLIGRTFHSIRSRYYKLLPHLETTRTMAQKKNVLPLPHDHIVQLYHKILQDVNLEGDMPLTSLLIPQSWSREDDLTLLSKVLSLREEERSVESNYENINLSSQRSAQECKARYETEYKPMYEAWSSGRSRQVIPPDILNVFESTNIERFPNPVLPTLGYATFSDQHFSRGPVIVRGGVLEEISSSPDGSEFSDSDVSQEDPEYASDVGSFKAAQFPPSLMASESRVVFGDLD